LIKIGCPRIGEAESNAVLEVMKTKNISTGDTVREFEEKFAKFVGVKHAVAVSSGTTALDISVKIAKLTTGTRRVVTTPFTFIATANTAKMNDCILDFGDIFKTNLALIPRKSSHHTISIPVNIFGIPSNIGKYEECADFVIYDSAEAIGTEYKGKHVGGFGDLEIFSFYANKLITTGEGGMITTNNETYADIARMMRNQGRDSMRTTWLDHKILGLNYRMTDIQAAIGIEQLKKVKGFINERKKFWKLYKKALPSKMTLKKFSPFVMPVLFDDPNKRELAMKTLEENNIESRVYFKPIYLQTPYYSIKGKLRYPNTEEIYRKILALPLHNNLIPEQVDLIAELVAEYA